MSVRERQIEAAAVAMWNRDWGADATGPDAHSDSMGVPYRPWSRETDEVRRSYRELARLALQAGRRVREEGK